MSRAILAPPEKPVPLANVFYALFGLGALAVALADLSVGIWYLGTLFIAFSAGGGLKGLKLNLPKESGGIGGPVIAVVVAIASTGACILGGSFIATLLPLGSIEFYNLVLPLGAVGATDIWSSGWGLLGPLVSAFLLFAYLLYIGFNEEAVFRGAVLDLLVALGLQSFGALGFVAALLGMACLFAGFHFMTGTIFTPQAFVLLVWLGLVWGVTSYATKSIWPSTFSHMTWNFLSFIQHGLILQAIAILVFQAIVIVASVLKTNSKGGGLNFPRWISGAGRIPVLGRDGKSAVAFQGDST